MVIVWDLSTKGACQTNFENLDKILNIAGTPNKGTSNKEILTGNKLQRH